ncbi:(R S)-reticuline 7-O-methyltransferase [Bienertia sinuspersici]
MRMLVRKQIFTVHYNQSSNQDEDDEEALYGLTITSKWLVHDQDLSLAPMFLTLCDHSMVKPWYEISHSIKDGESAFVKAHGESFWEMASNNPEFNNMFNVGMASVTRPSLEALIKGYKEEFTKFEGTIVDIGVGINFDLPHVVENAPQYHGVTHVGGDMFQEVPSADNFIIKV